MCSTTICTGCGIEIEDGEFCRDGKCIDCSSDEWGKMIDISPMVSPRILKRNMLRILWERICNPFLMFWKTIKQKIRKK